MEDNKYISNEIIVDGHKYNVLDYSFLWNKNLASLSSSNKHPNNKNKYRCDNCLMPPDL